MERRDDDYHNMNGVERKNGGQEKREKTMEEGKTRKQNKRRELKTEDTNWRNKTERTTRLN